jgi:acetolactate synthase regulatory subunit
MKYGLPKIAALILVAALSACSTMPVGPERVARVDELVARREFAKAEALLANIDARDPAFEALVVRRRAIRPLVVQFEENTVARVAELKALDEWPRAETLLYEALQKLPDSEALQIAEQRFYADRGERLDQIDREISLLRGEHLAAKAPLVEMAEEVHPKGIKTRWKSFLHGREAQQLAEELARCGEHALEEARYELAESCLKMASTLTDDAATSAQLAALQQRRADEQAQAVARAEAEREAETAARTARKTEKVDQLKARYRDLVEAGWWAAAKEVLAELQAQTPKDPDVIAWSQDLEKVVADRVQANIEEGQSLYSRGYLHEALAVWQDAAKLAPENTVLQAHISRVERFIAKLERLNKDDA